MASVEDVISLFEKHGDSEYGGEQVTQLEHALQAAQLGEQQSASESLIAAALLHDVGHLLHDLPDDAPEQGIDDRHETSGNNYLKEIFPRSVTEPVRLHVAAKRYLCAVDDRYMDQLSEPSVVSLNLQGGPMSTEEVAEFEANEFASDAVALRKWDDLAKDPEAKPPTLEHFAKVLRAVALPQD